MNTFLGIDNPDNYVLKPQREGGGNNHWGQEMKEKLLSLAGDPARAQFILMKKISPPVIKNKFVKRSVMSDELETISEVRRSHVPNFWVNRYISVHKHIGQLTVFCYLLLLSHPTIFSPDTYDYLKWDRIWAHLNASEYINMDFQFHRHFNLTQ